MTIGEECTLRTIGDTIGSDARNAGGGGGAHREMFSASSPEEILRITIT